MTRMEYAVKYGLPLRDVTEAACLLPNTEVFDERAMSKRLCERYSQKRDYYRNQQRVHSARLERCREKATEIDGYITRIRETGI